MKTWTLVRAVLDEAPRDWSPWTELFAEHGIEGTVQEDNPPSLGGYLYEGDGVDALVADLRAAGALRVDTEVIEEEDWSVAWRKFFVPRRVGNHFVVRPVWEPYELGPTDIEIVLDPGQAFGTGDHPTTRMCLELLEFEALQGKSVADIGCGSGILSVGACKLGASGVVGVDCDAASVDSSRENAERNGVEFEVYLGAGFDPLPHGDFDLVLSNIISAALIRLAPEAFSRIKPGGVWIVSGVIHSNWPDVLEAAQKCGFELVRKQEEGDWIAATFRR
ncbi:MAG: 50S ribosomal protein L11 methyltransferase [Chthonomonas sp.]|nr:50S ribosomal protein L11 methyltransferase [Chthonomonas sp.]